MPETTVLTTILGMIECEPKSGTVDSTELKDSAEEVLEYKRGD